MSQHKESIKWRHAGQHIPTDGSVVWCVVVQRWNNTGGWGGSYSLFTTFCSLLWIIHQRHISLIHTTVGSALQTVLTHHIPGFFFFSSESVLMSTAHLINSGMKNWKQLHPAGMEPGHSLAHIHLPQGRSQREWLGFRPQIIDMRGILGFIYAFIL